MTGARTGLGCRTRRHRTSREQFYRDTAAAIPAGRVGEVDDITQAYLFCLTQPFTTGSVLTVDGGTVLA